MHLTQFEYLSIKATMLRFKIVYQEVYDELLNHVASEIERKRVAGDPRSLEILIDEVINIDLGGEKGIKRMAMGRWQIYRLKIDRQIWKYYRKNFWLRFISISLICTSLGLLIPDDRNYAIGFFASTILVILSMLVYSLHQMKRISVMQGKQSLFKTTIRWQLFVPVIMLNVVFQLPGLIKTVTRQDLQQLIIFHKVIPMFIQYHAFFYALCCFRVMRERMKLVKHDT